MPDGREAAEGNQVSVTIDALGRICPIPVIMLADRIGEIRVGETIEILSDDPAVLHDLPAWCDGHPHALVRQAERDIGWSFVVRRGT